MAGKDGSTWKHGWVPTNAQAALLKAHHAASGSSAARPKAKAGSKHRSPSARTPLPSAERVKLREAYQGKDGGYQPQISAGKLSKGYTAGRGATKRDAAELARRYETMHGHAPAAKQVAGIRRAKPKAAARKSAKKR